MALSSLPATITGMSAGIYKYCLLLLVVIALAKVAVGQRGLAPEPKFRPQLSNQPKTAPTQEHEVPIKSCEHFGMACHKHGDGTGWRCEQNRTACYMNYSDWRYCADSNTIAHGYQDWWSPGRTNKASNRTTQQVEQLIILREELDAVSAAQSWAVDYNAATIRSYESMPCANASGLASDWISEHNWIRDIARFPAVRQVKTPRHLFKTWIPLFEKP